MFVFQSVHFRRIRENTAARLCSNIICFMPNRGRALMDCLHLSLLITSSSFGGGAFHFGRALRAQLGFLHFEHRARSIGIAIGKRVESIDAVLRRQLHQLVFSLVLFLWSVPIFKVDFASGTQRVLVIAAQIEVLLLLDALLALLGLCLLALALDGLVQILVLSVAHCTYSHHLLGLGPVRQLAGTARTANQAATIPAMVPSVDHRELVLTVGHHTDLREVVGDPECGRTLFARLDGLPQSHHLLHLLVPFAFGARVLRVNYKRLLRRVDLPALGAILCVLRDIPDSKRLVDRDLLVDLDLVVCGMVAGFLAVDEEIAEQDENVRDVLLPADLGQFAFFDEVSSGRH
mmetsp:Transcript_70598/g.112180  ORF Transcript_70598/g.112180 Transcript_70598/m.112180 type:complete len:347 (+) Transcript_70598:2352-3392(+)